MRVRKILLRCTNQSQKFLFLISHYLLLCFPLSLMPVLQKYGIPYWEQLLLIIGPGSLLGVLSIFLFAFIVSRLHLEKLVFVLPAATGTTQAYGWREVRGRFAVALGIFIFLTGCLFITLRILWG